MSRQYFRELLAPVMTADQSAVTGTTEAALWPVSPWSAFVANQLQPGQIYEIEAQGVITTPAATPGTLVITPRFGTTSSGTGLGASAASATLTVSQTNVPWRLSAKLACRDVGSTGHVALSGEFKCDRIGVNALLFGGPAVAVDTTSASGLWIGVTLGSASDSMTTQLVTVEAVN